MPSTDVKGLDQPWAETAAQRVIPGIGAAVFDTTGVDPDSPVAEVFAAGLIDAFNAGAREWNTELQARLIEAGVDLKLHDGKQQRTTPAEPSVPSPEAKNAPATAKRAPAIMARRGRLVQIVATRTSTDPATVAHAFTAVIVLALLAAGAAWLWLSGIAQVLVLLACGIWLALLAVAHLRANPAAPVTRSAGRT